MSLSSWFHDKWNGVKNAISPMINTVVSKVNGIIGNVKAGFTNVFGEGLVGIDETNAGTINDAVEEYIRTMEDCLASYNTKTDIGAGLKGDAKDAAEVFLEAIRDLMSAYVSNMRQSKHDLEEVLANYKAGSQNIAQQVTSDAEDIRSQAQSIHMD
jgi:hypothetical protein